MISSVWHKREGNLAPFKNDINQGTWKRLHCFTKSHNEIISLHLISSVWHKREGTLYPSKMIIKVCERNYIALLKATTKLSHFIWYDQRGASEKTNQCRPKESSKLPSNIVNTLTNAHFAHFGHCHGHHLMTISS